MSYRLGLTGSIGMGKSTTAAMFADLGHPVWDADEAVHRLYAPDGAAVAPVAAQFPAALHDGAIDRARLKAVLSENPAAFEKLEAIVHPLIATDRDDFAAQHSEASILVFDIPLLFENGLDAQMDGTAVVSASAETQRARVLARPGMTPETFAMIAARQMSDAEKRARADWVIPTETMDGARAAVTEICKEIQNHA